MSLDMNLRNRYTSCNHDIFWTTFGKSETSWVSRILLIFKNRNVSMFLKALKEFSRETSRFWSTVVNLGSMYDVIELREALMIRQVKTLQLAKKSMNILLPHLRGLDRVNLQSRYLFRSVSTLCYQRLRVFPLCNRKCYRQRLLTACVIGNNTLCQCPGIHYIYLYRYIVACSIWRNAV